jgi:hypothetical protein
MKNYVDAQCVLEATGVYIKIPLSPQIKSKSTTSLLDGALAFYLHRPP